MTTVYENHTLIRVYFADSCHFSCIFTAEQKPFEPNKLKTIILSDLQDITKAGLHYLLGTIKESISINEADSKKELLSNLTSTEIDMVVLDYTLFDFTGPEDLYNISCRFNHVHWVLFSDELSTDFLKTFVYNSTNFSVVFKDNHHEEIITALSLALKKERYICKKAHNQLLGKQPAIIVKQDNALTTSEKDILRLIALGKSNKEIAQERFSSIHTITTHRKNIFRKINVNSVHEATKYALRAGIIDASDYYI